MLLHFGAFTGRRLVPYDEITDYFPWYVNALHSAREGIFITLNPYKLGGMINMHLLAQYDVFYWVPLLTSSTPGLYGHQVIGLSHLLLIPASLLWVAWIHRARGPSLVGVAALGVMACFIGPALNYQQHMNAVESYCWGFVALACLETWLERGRLSAILLCSLAIVYAFDRFSSVAIFWPLYLLPYLVLNRKRAARHRGGVLHLLVGGAVALVLVTPFLVQGWHLWNSLSATVEMSVNNTLLPSMVFDALGLPMAGSIITTPILLWVISGRAMMKLPLAERVVHFVFLGSALVYAFGQYTPFCDFFRKMYPPAAFFRRPYAILYVLLTVLFFVIARNWTRLFVKVPVRWATVFTALLTAGTLAFIHFHHAYWMTSVLVGALAVSTIWSARHWTVFVPALVLQWVAICYVPFLNSQWRDVPLPLHPPIEDFQHLSALLPGHTHDSRKLFRVVSVGLPATFGAFASVVEYYNIAPDYSTIFPRELIKKTGIVHPHAAEIGAVFLAHPDLVGSRGMEDLSVRYYLFDPALFNTIRLQMRLGSGTLREVPVQSFWKVVEDTAYQPFVASEDQSGRISETAADVQTDRISFVVPSDSVQVNLGFIYDEWWRLEQGSTPVDQPSVVNNGGQLQVRSAGLRGQRISLHYGSRVFSWTIVLALSCYAGLLLLAAWSAWRWARGSSSLVR